MFIAALFLITKRWKQPNCPLMDEWINKIWCVCVCVCVHIYTHTHTHTMEYHSALKRKNILTRATTWVKRENIIS